MPVKFSHGLTDGYLGAGDQPVMEASFNTGIMQQQKTMQGSKMDGERVVSNQSAGLNQPVAQGTVVREKP